MDGVGDSIFLSGVESMVAVVGGEEGEEELLAASSVTVSWTVA